MSLPAFDKNLNLNFAIISFTFALKLDFILRDFGIDFSWMKDRKLGSFLSMEKKMHVGIGTFYTNKKITISSKQDTLKMLVNLRVSK